LIGSSLAFCVCVEWFMSIASYLAKRAVKAAAPAIAKKAEAVSSAFASGAGKSAAQRASQPHFTAAYNARVAAAAERETLQQGTSLAADMRLRAAAAQRAQSLERVAAKHEATAMAVEKQVSAAMQSVVSRNATKIGEQNVRLETGKTLNTIGMKASMAAVGAVGVAAGTIAALASKKQQIVDDWKERTAGNRSGHVESHPAASHHSDLAAGNGDGTYTVKTGKYAGTVRRNPAPHGHVDH
jgi:hypothetical protein